MGMQGFGTRGKTNQRSKTSPNLLALNLQPPTPPPLRYVEVRRDGAMRIRIEGQPPGRDSLLHVPTPHPPRPQTPFAPTPRIHHCHLRVPHIPQPSQDPSLECESRAMAPASELGSIGGIALGIPASLRKAAKVNLTSNI